MLNGKVAVVTGGMRGIGLAISRRFAENGAKLAIIDVCEPNEQQAKDLEALNTEVRTYQCNVADSTQVAEVCKAIIKDFGRVDILVNNAGITRDNLMIGMKEADFDSVIDVNLKGAFYMTKGVCRQMMKQRSGKIINVSSISGLFGNAGQTNYSASKAGLIGLTKSTAKELASRGVCCNAIAPGFIATDMTVDFQDNPEVLKTIPVGRFGKAEEVANLVFFLSTADYITGEVIRIDGGIAM